MAKNESSRLATLVSVVSFLVMLYLFFSSIELMSAAFKMSGAGLAQQLLTMASDPVAGLLIGFLATSLIQSSSTATTIVVGLVASDALTIQLAVPIIMGTNIGTTTTNTIVAIGHVTRPAEFERAFRPQWQALQFEWQLLARDLVAGTDFKRVAIRFHQSRPLPADGRSSVVAADRGWQSTGVRLRAGQTYQLTATGRFTLADKPRPWVSEPDGVSIRYHAGLPLGRRPVGGIWPRCSRRGP